MNETHLSPAVALSVAGFDSSGGAGVIADCRCFQRMGVFGVSAVTSVVAQSPGEVVSIEMISKKLIADQLFENFRSFPIAAAKSGMLGSLDAIIAMSEVFEKHRDIPLVVDPVLVASAGAQLTASKLVNHMRERLFPLATLVTPNRMEVETILGIKVSSLPEMIDAAGEFEVRFGSSCLVKGGHFGKEKPWVYDILSSGGVITEFKDTRLDVPDLHGTGCHLSAAVTAGLAKGWGLSASIANARDSLRGWMLNHHVWHSPRSVYALNATD